MVHFLYVDMLDDPRVNLMQLAGRQFAKISHCQQVLSGFAAAVRDQIAHRATDWEQEGARAAPLTSVSVCV